MKLELEVVVMSSKKYYKNVDIIRVLACLAVLLYHLNILKGGYLAVCVFFVLSGYLSCMSAFKKEKLSLKDYYLNRILKIYIPLMGIVFLTVALISLFSNINWFNLKPETTSVLLGYNNFWQLSANLDYFARHINSPFIHLWYIAILLQFDLIFPFIFMIFRKIGDKTHKSIPCIILSILTILSTVYFYYSSISKSMMVAYYDTFTRIFSLFFGVLLGFVHTYFGSMVSNKLKKSNWSKVIFYLYIIILITLFIFVDAQSKYFAVAMIVTTILSCRLIGYGILNENQKLNIFDKIVRFLSKISYEIYLVQYPIIFLFQYINLPQYVRFICIILLVLLVSYILNFICLKNSKFKGLKYVLGMVVLLISLYGLMKYVTAVDHTSEMKQLEQQLAKNQEIIKQKQEEYKNKMNQENEALESLIQELENGEAELHNVITNLSIVGIGDSVMLGAVSNLYKTFPNGYFDAEVSRTAWVAGGIIQSLKNKGILGNPIVLNLGANGDCPNSCKLDIIRKAENRKLFWINVTNDKDVSVNDEILDLSNKYDNVYVIDWNSVSKGHSEYFLSDGIHLTEEGRKIYVQTIYDRIYEVYLDEYKLKKENLIKEHENKTKNRITFYGNDILLNCFNDIESKFSEDSFVVNKDFNYELLKKDIERGVLENTLTNKIVFAFDTQANISNDEYKELIDLLGDREVYILSMQENQININLSNVKVVDFYNELEDSSEYLMVDRIHLTNEGNAALIKTFEDILKKQL